MNDLKIRSTSSLLIHCYSGKDKDSLINAIKENVYSQDGIHRLGIVSSKEELQKHRELALQLLQKQNVSTGWVTPFIHYRFKKINGEVAFAFTGAASAYPQMGKDLLQEFPGLVQGIHNYCKNPAFAGDWIYQTNSPEAKLPFYQLAGSSFMCQIHSVFFKKSIRTKTSCLYRTFFGGNQFNVCFRSLGRHGLTVERNQ